MKYTKEIDYFITRYSLIPDRQIDFESFMGVTKEQKFLDFLLSFESERKKEIFYNGFNYALYCQQLSPIHFFMSFAKGTDKIIGEKTDAGIMDSYVEDYKKCNILINIQSQFFIIEKNFEVSGNFISLKNIISKVITRFLESRYLYFQLDLLTEKNDFWKYVSTNSGNITDLEIKLSSPNLLDGITSVSDFLRKTNEQYNNTSFKFKLSNDNGKLNINPDNPFLQDAIRYSSAGCGTWKAKTKNSQQWYKNTDNPILLKLSDELGQLKDSDKQEINKVFEHVKHIDPENKEG